MKTEEKQPQCEEKKERKEKKRKGRKAQHINSGERIIN
jgi:hypothetical protein